MITPDFIERSNRKTLSLSVLKNGSVVVKAPISMSDSTISKFVEEKQNWIREKLMIVSDNISKFDDVLHYRSFLIYGNKYKIVLADVKRIETSNNFEILVPKKYETEKILKNLKQWYKKRAKQVLGERLAYVEQKIRLKSSLFKIGDSKGRWGSCSSSGVICLNWRVVMLPPKIIDYVIVHELCHLVELNHSKNFWKLVGTFLPDFERLKKEIKDYGVLLGIFN